MAIGDVFIRGNFVFWSTPAQHLQDHCGGTRPAFPNLSGNNNYSATDLVHMLCVSHFKFV